MEPLPAWYLRRRAHYLPGNEVRLLKGGDELFPALVAAVNQAGVAGRIGYISTAGGAFLEFLEGRKLPGVEALTEAPR